MRIFLTGASGYIGSAVARALRKSGHEIVGLTHSPEKAPALSALGVRPVVGDLKKPETYREEAAACEALIHAGFEYGPQAADADGAALEALIAAAREAKAPRFLVYTSGVWVLGPKRAAAADEQAPLAPPEVVGWRPAHEKKALDAASERLSTVVVRPGCVYGEQKGLYGMMFQSAIDKHAIQLVGSGSNCWASVYLDDLAELYRLVIERRPAGVLHATDGAAEPLREVAEAFLDAAGGGSVETLPLEQARKTMGPFADALALDQRVSSEKARRELGWRPAMTSVAKNAMNLLKQWKERVGPASVA